MFKILALLGLVCVSQGCSFNDPNVSPGRSVMIHLFEWKWSDIATECEQFLSAKGYAGVQVSPPNEHAVISNPWQPWYQRYQPVSYKLQSRSGNESQFIDMVTRCNAVGVRIYVDAVINHMARPDGATTGSGGSTFNSPSRLFPGVPYGPNDFNDGKCNSNSGEIESYNDIYQVRDCRLANLPDLKLEAPYVRDKIAEYLNRLIDIGVAGFRIDAAKHMWPGDLQVIFGKLKNLRPDVFGYGKKPFIYQEVIDLGSEPIKNTQYTHLGRVTEFKYGKYLSDVVLKKNNQRLAYLKNFGTGWGFIPSDDSLAFVDNHDNQRGHGGGGEILTYKTSKQYKIANAFMLAWPYAFVQIMSSYNFPSHQDWLGPPSDANGNTNSVTINSNDGTCGGGWICEHRWRQIYNMNIFRNVVGFEPVANWWDNSFQAVAFSRGNRGFIFINNESFTINRTFQTGLPAGQYCDVISGNKVGTSCTGLVITVNTDGTASISIDGSGQDPVVAIHVDSKL